MQCFVAQAAAPLRLPCRPSRAARLVVRASAGELEPWQISKLQQALVAGRRQVKVEKLCKELGLPRGTVLQWLKDAPPLDRTQQSLIEARVAAEAAAQERRVMLQEARQQAAGGRGGSSSAAGGGQPSAAGGSNRSGSTPAWRSYSKKKALGRQAEATLEMIFSRTQWPSDEAVSSLWDLHRLPREKVVEWFKQRRQQEQRELRGGAGKGRSGGGSGGARGGSSGGSTDWDAEWDSE